MKFLSQEGLAYLWTKIQQGFEALASRIASSETAIAGKVDTATYSAGLDGKVDKVDGKGLSSNDYTDTEKTKLAGIAEGANNYSLPTAAAGTLGGVKVGTNLSIDANGVLSARDTTYNNASSSEAGLMSAADKAKLDGIESGANAYSLPTATDRVRGGVIMDYFINQNSDNPLANSAIVAALEEKVDKVANKGLSTNDYTTAEKNKLAGIASGATAVTVDNYLNENSSNPLANSVIFAEVWDTRNSIRAGGLSVWTDHFSGDEDKNWFFRDYNGHAILHMERIGTSGASVTSVNVANLPSGVEWASNQTVYLKGSDGVSYKLDMESGGHAITLRKTEGGSFTANFSFSYTGLLNISIS